MIRSTAARASAGPPALMCRVIRPVADSFITPVGAPVACRSIVPAGGSGVSRVMPASSSA